MAQGSSSWTEKYTSQEPTTYNNEIRFQDNGAFSFETFTMPENTVLWITKPVSTKCQSPPNAMWQSIDAYEVMLVIGPHWSKQAVVFWAPYTRKPIIWGMVQ